jgi:HSP20 family molecular chaperone IbpA
VAEKEDKIMAAQPERGQSGQPTGQADQAQRNQGAGQQAGQAAGQQAGDIARRPAEQVGDGPTFIPPTDIFETKDNILMLLDMPGADPESLNVTLEKLELTVAARSTISEPQGYTPIHAEFRAGNYERSFNLPDEVDNERIEAVFKNGVLRLTLPKAQTPARRIAVKTA